MSYSTVYLIGAGIAVVGIAMLIGGSRMKLRSRGVGPLGIVGTVVLGIGGVAALVVGLGLKKVYVFHGTGGTIAVDKHVLVGSLSSISLHDGKPLAVKPYYGDAALYVINDTDRPLHVETARYASSRSELGRGSDPNSTIEVGAVGHLDAIDNVGPDDPLPSIVQSKTSSATRTWVSW